MHGAGERDAGRPVRGGEPGRDRRLGRGEPQPVHPYRRGVAQHQVGTHAGERGLAGQLPGRAVGQRQRGDREDTARGEVLGQLVEVPPGGLGGATQRLGQHDHVGRIGLGQRVDHPHRAAGQLRAQLVAGPQQRYRGQRVPGPQSGQGRGQYRRLRGGGDHQPGLRARVPGQLGGERAGCPLTQRDLTQQRYRAARGLGHVASIGAPVVGLRLRRRGRTSLEPWSSS